MTSIFISYRRSTSKYLARLLYDRLRGGEADVFLDVENINAGHFDEALREQIMHRTNFLLVLAPGTLDRCHEPGDWLRHEIETAITTQRNIVPLLVDGFTFEANRAHLTGPLAELPRFNGINLYYDYFDEGVEKLKRRFLQGGPINGRSLATPPAIMPPTPAEMQAEQTMLRAYLYHQAGELDEATRQYTQALNLNPAHDAAYVNRGLARYAQGDMLGAIEDYSAALKINPDDDAAYLNRGVAYAAKRQWGKARVDYDHALELNPTYAKAYYSRGNMRYELADMHGAIADYSTALQYDPTLMQAYLNRGVTHYDMGMDHAAIADYSQVIALDPTSADAYNNRGNAYLALQETEAALADYEAAIDLNSPDAYNNRAQLRLRLGDTAGALADFDTAHAMLPANVPILFNRGSLRLQTGDTLGAIEDFSAVLVQVPSEVAALMRRGLAYEQYGDLIAALRDYEQALALGAGRLYGADFVAHVADLQRRGG